MKWLALLLLLVAICSQVHTIHLQIFNMYKQGGVAFLCLICGLSVDCHVDIEDYMNRCMVSPTMDVPLSYNSLIILQWRLLSPPLTWPDRGKHQEP